MKHPLIFLAGATGCAGSHALLDILGSDPDARVRALYFKHTKPFIKDKRICYVYGDLRLEADAARLLRGCTAAVLAAGHVTGAAKTVVDQAAQIRDNVVMNMNALAAAARAGVRRVVYVGSATVYQESERPLKEDELDFNADPPKAFFGLAWGMRFMEKLCRYWHQAAGLEIAMARVTNIFGPYAKFDPAASHFIPALIRKAVDRQDPFEVWGSPDVTRDVLPAEDFGRAVSLMLKTPGLKCDVFNIGSGVATTVGDAARWILDAARHEPKSIVYLSGKPTTVRCRQFDIKKAKDVLGWLPSLSVEVGIRKTVAWWQDNKRTWRK
jgi:nucleoside-diphosphate-sugar epimerase